MKPACSAAKPERTTRPSKVGRPQSDSWREEMSILPLFLRRPSAGSHTKAASMSPRSHAATMLGGCMLRSFTSSGGMPNCSSANSA